MASPLEMYSKFGLANWICSAKWWKLVGKWPMADWYFWFCIIDAIDLTAACGYDCQKVISCIKNLYTYNTSAPITLKWYAICNTEDIWDWHCLIFMICCSVFPCHWWWQTRVGWRVSVNLWELLLPHIPCTVRRRNWGHFWWLLLPIH